MYPASPQPVPGVAAVVLGDLNAVGRWVTIFFLTLYVTINVSAAAEKWADHTVLTSDNPRTEDPESIICDILAGFKRPGEVEREGDRRLAIERALALDPANVNVRNSLGVCHGVLGDLEKAAAEFATAARLDPSEAMALYNLGMVCLLGENDREQALDYLNRARRLDGDLHPLEQETHRPA